MNYIYIYIYIGFLKKETFMPCHGYFCYEYLYEEEEHQLY